MNWPISWKKDNYNKNNNNNNFIAGFHLAAEIILFSYIIPLFLMK